MDTICETCGKHAEKVCKRCKLYYCTESCQKEDWSNHKQTCKRSKGIRLNDEMHAPIMKMATSVVTPVYRGKELVFIPTITGKVPKNLYTIDSEPAKEMRKEMGFTDEDMDGFSHVCNLELYRILFGHLDLIQIQQMLKSGDGMNQVIRDSLEEKIALGKATISDRLMLKKMKKMERSFEDSLSPVLSKEYKHKSQLSAKSATESCPYLDIVKEKSV